MEDHSSLLMAWITMTTRYSLNPLSLSDKEGALFTTHELVNQRHQAGRGKCENHMTIQQILKLQIACIQAQ